MGKRAYQLNERDALAALVFLVLVLLIFGWTVVVVAAFGGKPAMALLARFGTWPRAHERTVSAVTGVVIGLLFLLRGLAGLRGAKAHSR